MTSMSKIAQASQLEPCDLDRLIDQLSKIRGQMVEFEGTCAGTLGTVAPSWSASARNLTHYLALRSHDLRSIQATLASLGLSSLGRSEGGTLATLDAVLRVLSRLANREAQSVPAVPNSLALGHQLLSEHTETLFGPPPAGRSVRMMVTVPGEAADDYPLIRDLLRGGMDCMRVNCAHDTPEVWGHLIAHLRRAQVEIGRSCRVLMDLGDRNCKPDRFRPVRKWSKYGRLEMTSAK